jgi:phage baseplate assembly protein W
MFDIEFIDASDNPYDLTMADLAAIDWGCAGIKEILQDVYRLILTPKLTVRLDRLLGFEGDWLDAPMPESADIFIAEVLAVIHLYEQRVEILDVSFRGELTGKMVAVIKLALRNVISGTLTPYTQEIRYPV